MADEMLPYLWLLWLSSCDYKIDCLALAFLISQFFRRKCNVQGNYEVDFARIFLSPSTWFGVSRTAGSKGSDLCVSLCAGIETLFILSQDIFKNFFLFFLSVDCYSASETPSTCFPQVHQVPGLIYKIASWSCSWPHTGASYSLQHTLLCMES